MKVMREPKKPFSIFVNDAQIVKMATIIFENGERTTLRFQFTKAARGLTKQELAQSLLESFKNQTNMVHKVIKVIIK